MLAHDIFTDVINLLHTPYSFFVHPIWYGSGMGQVNTKSKYKSGQLNPDYVPAKVLTTSYVKLRQSISYWWKFLNGTTRHQLILLYIWATRLEEIIIKYAIMPYIKIMAEEDFMSTLYKNHMNLTIEVLDYECMALHLYEIN